MNCTEEEWYLNGEKVEIDTSLSLEKKRSIIKLMKIELKSDKKDKISNLIDDLNDKTKNFAQKIIDSNFSNFVGKEIDVLDKS